MLTQQLVQLPLPGVLPGVSAFISFPKEVPALDVKIFARSLRLHIELTEHTATTATPAVITFSLFHLKYVPTLPDICD